MKHIHEYGPFSVYRLRNKKEHKNFLDIALVGYDGFGWECGSDNSESRRPIICVEVCGLKLLYLELFRSGFEVWILGFWWIR